MGSLGRDALTSEAALVAGDPSVQARLNVALNLWLRNRAIKDMWPEVIKRAVTIPIPQGAPSINIGAVPGGAANSGITDQIMRVLDPAWIYSSTYSARGECRIRQISGGTIDDDETINNPATQIGIPTRCKVRILGYQPGQPMQRGAWTLVFSPIPDIAYLGAFDYWYVPADLNPTVGGADQNTQPWYPNDETMLTYLIANAWRYRGRLQAYQSGLAEAAQMVNADKVALTTVPGTDDTNELDEGVFRTSPPSNYPQW